MSVGDSACSTLKHAWASGKALHVVASYRNSSTIVKHEKMRNTGNLVILVVHQKSAVRGEIAHSVRQWCPLWHDVGIGGK